MPRLLALLAVLFGSTIVAAQQLCTSDWVPFRVAGPGLGVMSLADFDDGTGAALWVGGSGLEDDAGGASFGVVRWKNGQLQGVGTGQAYALTACDLGGGAQLFAGGAFPTCPGTPCSTNAGLARWNGASFAPLGDALSSGGLVLALAEFDDGTGPALYAGGTFTSIGSVPAAHIARWNGTSWSTVGQGTNNDVNALCVFDDGSGPALYAAGRFSQAGLTLAARVARWSAAGWQPVGAGLGTSTVTSLAVFDAGSGPRLYAGTFNSGGSVWRFDGATWTNVGASTNRVNALHVATLQGVPRLVATGVFTSLGGTPASGIAAFDGASWTALANGLRLRAADATGYALATHDAGGGAALYAGGDFTSAGSAGALGLAAWNGSTWSALRPSNSVSGTVSLLQRDVASRSLVVGGDFESAGPIAARRVARWNGTAWSALGSGLSSTPLACVAFDDGTGPGLVFGGNFTEAGGIPVARIARWNGTAWSALGAGFDGWVEALAVHDDGAGVRLYAAGNFSNSGATPVARVARWNGSAWEPLGSGMNARVRALASFDDGGGPALFACGEFSIAGGLAASSIARWNGTSWSPLGAGLTDGVGGYPPIAYALCVHDDGSGPRLFAGGQFTRAGGTPTNGIAAWNGTAWQATSGSAPNEVYGLTSWRTANGPVLVTRQFAAGFSSGVARYAAGIWSPVGAWPGNATTVQTFDAGGLGGDLLVIGGSWGTVVGQRSDYLVAQKGCALDGGPFCAGDGGDPTVTIACPCGNTGGAGRGCANSVQPLGALLSVYGATATDDVQLVGTGMPLTAPCVFLKGDAEEIGGVVFGDGVRCVGGSLIRLATLLSSGGSATYPGPTNPSLSVRGGTPPGSGLRAEYQVYFRNAAAAFCPPALFNVSNGWRIVW